MLVDAGKMTEAEGKDHGKRQKKRWKKTHEYQKKGAVIFSECHFWPLPCRFRERGRIQPLCVCHLGCLHIGLYDCGGLAAKRKCCI